MIYHPDGCVYIYFPVLGSCQTACTAYCHPYYVLLPSGVSVASKVRPLKLCIYRMAGNFGGKIFWRIAENMPFGGIYFGGLVGLSHNDIHSKMAN